MRRLPLYFLCGSLPPSFGGLDPNSATCPAARRTFSTPAAKPSSRKTISPQGEVSKRRSKNHPSPTPTTIPPMNSPESLKAFPNPPPPLPFLVSSSPFFDEEFRAARASSSLRRRCSSPSGSCCSAIRTSSRLQPRKYHLEVAGNIVRGPAPVKPRRCAV